MSPECIAIQNDLRKLGIEGQDVAVHASLKSFGFVEGGPEMIVEALVGVCRNVLTPAFSRIGRTNPPPEDRPIQNGWDYDDYREPTPEKPFDPASFNPASGLDINMMGKIPESMLRAEGTVRSLHPTVSWAANGPESAWYCADHSTDDPNLPLKRLAERDGYVLLLGVDLAKCTAIHLAEEVAGRRAFIRWVLYADGQIRRVREYGCSRAFPRLAPHLRSIEVQQTVGQSRATLYPARALVRMASEIIKENPDLTICDNPRLCRCQDAAKGGPLEDS